MGFMGLVLGFAHTINSPRFFSLSLDETGDEKSRKLLESNDSSSVQLA